MPEQATCPFADGCPFRECKTREEIIAKFQELQDDPVWGDLIAKFEKCPLWKRCPMSNHETPMVHSAV